MTPLLTVIPYCNKDSALAKALLLWIDEIGTPKLPAILLAADSSVPKDTITEIQNLAKKVSYYTRTMLVPVSPGGWAPNKMFLAVANQIKENYRCYWFWMEPDLTPLTAVWFERLSEQWEGCPKRFMGAIIRQDKDPALPKEHLTGCAIYPQGAFDLFNSIDSIKSGSQAWDIGSASVVVPKAAHTDLLFHFWGQPDLAPTFVVRKEPGKEYGVNCFALDRIPQSAVMMHRCKDGTLMNALRQRNAEAKSPAPAATAPAPATISTPSTPAKPSAPATVNK